MATHKRALIFAHYDFERIVDPHVIYYLTALKKHIDTIVFVSTGANDSDLKALSEICSIAICRPNQGYDFMSWKLGLSYLTDLNNYDEILFANDSVYAPIFDISAMLAKSESLCCDFWGVTRSAEINQHIQSFFFAFRRNLINSECFYDFWNSVEVLSNKDDIIQKYEAGMTSFFEKSGFISGAIFETGNPGFFSEVMQIFKNGSFRNKKNIARIRKLLRRKIPLNPVHYYWKSILESGIPMIKVELLRDNPCHIDAVLIQNYLQQYPIHVELIKKHLQRVCAKNGIYTS